MDIIFPLDTRETINAMRQAIGRNITLYVEQTVPCSACSIDPVTNTSTNSFCTVCSGVGYIVTLSGYTVLAHITHAPQDLVKYTPGGSYADGDCIAQVEYLPATMTVLEHTKMLVVDNDQYTIKNKTLRGVPEINRVILNLKQKD